MCGIFGIALREPTSLNDILKTLERLEVQQYAQEPRPVGGYGAGIAVLTDEGEILSEKVGKIQDSPAKALAEEVSKRGLHDPAVLLGHVRMPTPEYMKTAEHRETAQPYLAQSDRNLTIASVHNGEVENYLDIRKELGSKHILESDKIGLIDSEVIPHYFVELLERNNDVRQALYSLFTGLHGSAAIGLLHVDDENSIIHLIHKGQTRGLTVWTNDKNEVLFCSRKEPVTEMLHHLLTKHRFREKISIGYHEDIGLQVSFPFIWG
jgi:glucosamine 6-phosphate synthetase-like amidotransferase/phosphosugar isomerase protein